MSGILQPFPVAPVAGDSRADPGFQVQFRRGGDLLEDTVIADLQTQFQVHATAVIEARVNASGQAQWRITNNKAGNDRAWVTFHHDGNPPKDYAHLRGATDARLLLHPVARNPAGTRLFPGPGVARRVRGVRLYRNGFRVAPYGDFEDDWLGLDHLYSRRSATLAPVANRNFFGVVEVEDPDGTRFEERTSREGLVDTPEFEELRKFLPAVLISAVNTIAADRGRIGSASSRTPRSKPNAGSYVDRSRERLSNLIENVQTKPDPPTALIVETLKRD